MSQFKSRLLVEGVRTFEQSVEKSASDTTVLPASQNNLGFEEQLFLRAKTQDQQLQISSLFSHFSRLSKNIIRFLSLALFILGALAVQKMLFSEQTATINFFWAFALFFIPNLLMFFLWLFIFLRPTHLQNSSLARLCLALTKSFDRRFNKQISEQEGYWSLFRCYFDIHFANAIGRFKLSALTHRLWLSYFCGATLMSVVMLATHQVDFIWQTSILSSSSFQSMTQILAFLPEQLGFTVPTITQIQDSHIGSEQLLDAENRRLAWSSLLISSLLLYGLLPRLILYVAMHYQLRRAKGNFRLNLTLPYYVQLRQLLKPNKTSLGITDADQESPDTHEKKVLTKSDNNVNNVPECFQPLALELSQAQFTIAQSHFTQSQFEQANEGGLQMMANVCDFASQQSCLTELAKNNRLNVGLYVAQNRAPDRGIKRFLHQLTEMNNKSFFLFLIVDKTRNEQRDSDWYQLADQVAIRLENIVHIEAQEKSHE